MKIAFASAQNPSTTIGYFSGIPFHLYWALNRQMTTVPLGIAVSGAPKWWEFYARLMGKVTRRQKRWGMRPSILKELAAKTAEKAVAFDVDVVLTIGQGSLVFWDSPLPIASFSDLLYGSVGESGFREQAEVPRKMHKADQALMKTYAQRAVDNAVHIFVTSEFVLDGARRYGTNIPSEKVTVTQIGANFREPPPFNNSRKTPPPLRLLWLGTSWEGKGGPEALAVLDSLIEMGLEVELHLVGRFPDNLSHPKVFGHGFLSKDVAEEKARLLDVYRQSHLLLLPTRKDLTPSGLAEAAALGVPAITTPVGGIPGMFNADEVILLPFARYRQEAPAVIFDLVANGHLPKMAEKVRHRFETALSWDIIAKKIVSKLDTVLESS